MKKMDILKKNISFFMVVLTLLFVFVSCGFNSHTKVVEKFLDNFKNGKVLESYVYLVDDEESQTFKNCMDTIMNSQNSESGLGKLNKSMLEKIFDFTYEIVEVKKEEKSASAFIKLKYFDLYKAYDGALKEFLTKSLDFENLDNLYDIEYITNLLIEHINKLEREEKTLEINLVKDKDWKIIMGREFTELLTANSIKLVNLIKENISIE